MDGQTKKFPINCSHLKRVKIMSKNKDLSSLNLSLVAIITSAPA